MNICSLSSLAAQHECKRAYGEHIRGGGREHSSEREVRVIGERVHSAAGGGAGENRTGRRVCRNALHVVNGAGGEERSGATLPRGARGQRAGHRAHLNGGPPDAGIDACAMVGLLVRIRYTPLEAALELLDSTRVHAILAATSSACTLSGQLAFKWRAIIARRHCGARTGEAALLNSRIP